MHLPLQVVDGNFVVTTLKDCPTSLVRTNQLHRSNMKIINEHVCIVFICKRESSGHSHTYIPITWAANGAVALQNLALHCGKAMPLQTPSSEENIQWLLNVYISYHFFFYSLQGRFAWLFDTHLEF